uniref:Uncharacterized protein n=1 Tax=Medicago truncatula TaxID=3880 RepID=B7FHJ7_MEDTR|nr:unknown [Medicago truncatula]
MATRIDQHIEFQNFPTPNVCELVSLSIYECTIRRTMCSTPT